jgi:pimeloyl-ACP methyl ester carboxylesterase
LICRQQTIQVLARTYAGIDDNAHDIFIGAIDFFSGRFDAQNLSVCLDPATVSMKRMATFLTFVIIGYVGLCALIFLVQDRMLFFPGANDPRAVTILKPWQRSIETPQATLSGWLIGARDPPNAPLVFYFGGNAEDISVTGLEVGNKADANFVLMNYRGYGASDGAPSQSALFTDALSVYDTLIDTTVHNGKIVAFGRSLGSGVAVYLASQRKVDAVVLATPYDSIRNVARRHYPWLPVATLIRHPFDSLALAPGLNIQALFLVAERDEIIPPLHAQQLADNWGGSTRWVLIEGASHNSISADPRYWASIGEFL